MSDEQVKFMIDCNHLYLDIAATGKKLSENKRGVALQQARDWTLDWCKSLFACWTKLSITKIYGVMLEKGKQMLNYS